MDVKVASHGKSMVQRYEQSMKRLRIVDKCVHVTH